MPGSDGPGEQMIKTDTATADTTFFVRQAACYASSNDPQKAAATAAQGVAKFKNNAALWSLYAQTLRLRDSCRSHSRPRRRR